MHKVGSEADNEHRFKHMDEKHLLRVSLSCLQTVGKDHTHHSTYSVLFAVCLHFGGWFLCEVMAVMNVAMFNFSATCSSGKSS